MPLIVSLEIEAIYTHKIQLHGRGFVIHMSQPSSFIPIIVLKAVHASLGSGFSFRGWTYATTAVMLTPEHLL